MALIFKADNHEYTSVDEEEVIDWISATSFISFFKQDFDAPKQAQKSAKNKKSKWFGMTEEEILAAWASEAKRATDLGTWYHNQREEDLCSLNTIVREGVEVPVYPPVVVDGLKYAPTQKLGEGVYPEHFVYLKSFGICGQSDFTEVVMNKVNIEDYKTNKEIQLSSYKNWEGISQKMKHPVSHLDDCNFNHYSLQLSLYLYIILRHNPKLEPGKLTIRHIKFKKAGDDKYGYPIAELDSEGEPIVEEIVSYDVPYLKDEVVALLNYLQDFRPKFKKKKK
jgi:hypothetical protein